MKIRIEQVTVIEDDRGLVFEPLTADDFKFQRNAHVVVSRPGAVRGNHYHKRGTEVIAVQGPARVCFREDKTIREVDVPDNEVFRFTFPPHVSHAIQHTGTEPGILAAFNTLEHDPENPDTVEDILIPV